MTEDSGVGKTERTPLILITVLVFVAGSVSMASEILLSRFIAPFFGSSLLIWTLVIFTVLLSLSVGYMVGGRLADRWGDEEPLLRALQLAALLLGVGPFLCRGILLSTLSASNPVVPGIGLTVTIAYFCLPILMVAMTGPYMIRILTASRGEVGFQAGRVLGVSTLGSIIGTFLPTYVLIPGLGTIKSFLVLSVALCSVAVVTHLKTRDRGRSPHVWVLAPLVGLWFFDPGVLRPVPGTIEEVESIYNNIKVREQNFVDVNDKPYWRRLLVLNEGFAVHSITLQRTAAHYPLVGSVWDYMSLMPVVLDRASRDLDMAIVGLAGGSVAKGVVHFFEDTHEVSVQGAELDPKILEIARRLFEMTEPQIEGFAQDGRAFLASAEPGSYDVILTDAYRQPYIPFHLTTQEYFATVASRLAPGGFAMINCGARNEDDELLVRLQMTMKAEFEHVYRMEVPRLSPLFANYLVLGSQEPMNFDGLVRQERVVDLMRRHPGLNLFRVLKNIQDRMKTFEPVPGTERLTDDKAPVEYLVDLVILKTIFDPSFEIPESAR